MTMRNLTRMLASAAIIITTGAAPLAKQGDRDSNEVTYQSINPGQSVGPGVVCDEVFLVTEYYDENWNFISADWQFLEYQNCVYSVEGR